ncbi:restriction endonuclease subunit S, partial [Lactiplantibacillus plantarum]|uniref:restriction endonuclease subunit S n=1 Tax=Lactiplantibacillus plantarum TaxID=1590 RepID=UPI0025B3F0F8
IREGIPYFYTIQKSFMHLHKIFYALAIYRQSKDKIAFQRSVAIIRGKEEIIDNYFLMFSFQLPTIKKILQRVTSISAQPGIYLRDLSNIEVWYPVISEQQKIIALLKNICNLIAANE